MRALTWQGKHNVKVMDVPDPVLQEPTDAIIKVTSTAICGSDLHLYNVLGPFLDAGDVLGHETMGVVTEVGAAVENLAVGDRVVIPFPIACGHCWMCQRGLQTQCETTQVREQGSGAAIFGYSKLYGQIPGGQAQFLRVPHAQYGAIKVPTDDEPDERYLFMSDVLPTAWQAVEYAQIPAGGSVLVVGLGPIGQLAARVARHRGAGLVMGVDRVPERLAMAARHGVTTIDATATDVMEAAREQTSGRGPDAVIDAVGMEAHGSHLVQGAQAIMGALPDPVARTLFNNVGMDRLAALNLACDAVRRGGTVSLSGVYGGAADPLNLMHLFDKQLTIRMGQANVHRWISALWPLVTDPADPLGVLDLRTHRLPLEAAPEGYEMFNARRDGCIKVVLDPLLNAE